MIDGVVVIRTCQSEIEADLVISELADAGIDAVITAATMNTPNYPSLQFVQGVDVAVRMEDVEAAKAFLEAQAADVDEVN